MYTTGRIFIGVSLGGSRNLSNGVEVINNEPVNRRGGQLGNEEVGKEVRTRKLGRGSWDVTRSTSSRRIVGFYTIERLSQISYNKDSKQYSTLDFKYTPQKIQDFYQEYLRATRPLKSLNIQIEAQNDRKDNYNKLDDDLF